MRIDCGTPSLTRINSAAVTGSEFVQFAVRETADNADLVEEATAAARSMEEQAGELTNTVALFKIDSTGAATAPRRPSGVASKAMTQAAKPPYKTPARVAHRPTKQVALAGEDKQWQEF
ncbi:hypothetical protein [Xanthomonas sp. MUS 060]|uniref:hypothetical protein n=2 Tax=Xanthomonas sp. MUS 060 TaxID=1588031 RepID=UPI0005F28D06|nr:hypothetical protein [Xanthomonas sp. MUS 060]